MTEHIYLYNNLKQLRKSKGWKQGEMHTLCGISRATWSNYENGNTEPDIKSLVRIAKVFEVSLDDLILRNLESSLTADANGTPKSRNYPVEHHPETIAKEPENLSTWVVLQQLREIQGKLDKLLDNEV